MSSIRTIKEQQHAITLEHARAEDIRGLTQVLMTLALLALVWWAALLSVNVSLWLTAASILLISLFSVRVFALMHECGQRQLVSHSAAQSHIWFSPGRGLGHAPVCVVAASQLF